MDKYFYPDVNLWNFFIIKHLQTTYGLTYHADYQSKKVEVAWGAKRMCYNG